MLECVLENDQVNILWDFNIQRIEHSKPDITLVNGQGSGEINVCMVASVPGDSHTVKTEFEKIENYAELRLDMEMDVEQKDSSYPCSDRGI